MRELRRANVFTICKKWQHKRLLNHHADLVVEEDRHLVPAISGQMFTRVLLHLADDEVVRERSTERHA